MAVKTITNFRSQLSGGGARPTLFEVNIENFAGESGNLNTGQGAPDTEAIAWAGAGSPGNDFRFLCKATSMPTQTIGVVDVPFRGRILKVAGDRTFEPWTVTVINDESFNIRKAFESWTEKINAIDSGVGSVDPKSYMGQGFINQLSRSVSRGATSIAADTANQKVLHSYKVQEIWPSEISSIDLSYESSDAIEEFTVTFQVNYMERGEGAQAPADPQSSIPQTVTV